MTTSEAVVSIAGTSKDNSVTVTFATYKNPISTSGTDKYTISILDAGDNTLASYVNDCTGACSTLTAAGISVTVTSDSNQVGSANAIFTFEFTNALGLVAGGTIQVKFPEIKTYTTNYPSLLTSISTCKEVSSNLESITCRVETDGVTMTISNLVNTDTIGTFRF